MVVRFLLSVALVVGAAFLVQAAGGDEISVTSSDWAWWRGPTRNGIAHADQSPPLHWGEEQNILWKSPVPGRGHSSPTVVGDRVFLGVADEQQEIQSVICFDRETGEQMWKTDIHRGGFAPTTGRPGHPRSSKASTTVASDGNRIFINFFNHDAVFITALSLDGEQLWQQKVTDYVVHQGYGTSPAVYGPLVIVVADNKGGGALTGYDRVTGQVAWTVKRPALPNYTSPMILNIDGRDQVILTGQDTISSYEPLTGNANWEVKGATAECVTSVVSDGTYVVTSGGYPSKHISVVRGDASGEVVWRNDVQVYVPSMLVYEGHIYGVTDTGDAFCYDMQSSTPLWEHRLGGHFSASPVLVGGNIYATGESGTTYIFKASPAAFELIAENTIVADDVQATAAICGSRIYMHVSQKRDGQYQEMLYCIAEGK
ncbi:MAG: PQQ-binding-like beta-propeller repeat protein [Candidatus Hydrogenedentes bacterium]|nr:PQQ-binding-like beta-propeller repeat protein [Candidatus Hydrogenedentota bacterium]